MRATGTNELMDLWSDIQFLKRIAKVSGSYRSKRLIVEKYEEYKSLGGVNQDLEIEKWKERL